ncbi:uncharacterized protein LOC129724342 [Wyeomyia smithii]|uniref:uncharacterized protein LOC129724342 n=1 Tax=Wyeomyia smithii TaxID=174621 RepID=UPI0024681AC1|nr:uncharacterized protein LOC129724342 [Wyeomyia smithii]XP_055535099.1 uncharacterized protein LOC129724342 [Wyeomyia smithii]XP_055535108.1 uncharacterized protein LOC129724342 [Wyeomyia smithii]
MTLYWWNHWFWITVCGVVLIECTPLSSIDSYPSKLAKLEENSNKSTYLKRAGEFSSMTAGGGGGNVSGRPGPHFISSLPPMAAASSGVLPSPSNGGSQTAPTVNSIVSDEAFVPEHQTDIDDTFAGGSLAGTDFAPGVMTYTRKDAEAGSSTAPSAGVTEETVVSSTTATAAVVTGSDRRFKKNGTIFTRNEQNITTLKLKNYNRGMERDDLKEPPRVPDRGTRLVETLLLTAVDNSTDAALLTLEHGTERVELVDEDTGNGTIVRVTNNPDESPDDDNATLAVLPSVPIDDDAPSLSSRDNRSSFNTGSSNSSFSSSSDSSNSDRDIPDASHSDSTSSEGEGETGSVPSASDRRIGKILSSDFRDFIGSGTNPNASSYISRAIAFSTQNLQEGIDDQDHPLEDDDYRRSSRAQQRLNVGAISGICLASLGVLSGLSAALIILYRRYLYINKPQTLSEPDSSGYIDDSTIRDNSDEMYSLDNDSFLNSLEAMTIQNYWTDNVKHTKL